MTVNLQIGSIGKDVGSVETRLKQIKHVSTGISYYTGSIDNSFGPVLDVSVRTYQKDQNLLIDGIVGPITWKSLFKADYPSTGGYIPTPNPTPIPEVGSDAWVKYIIETKFGIKITSKEILYNIITNHGIYADFYNLEHSLVDAVQNHAWNDGINCAEWCEYIAKPILNTLGLVVGKDYWIAHCYVTCSDGKQYGHYFIIFSNGFSLNTNLSPVNSNFYDLAGAAESRRPEGTLICPEGPCYIDRYMLNISS